MIRKQCLVGAMFVLLLAAPGCSSDETETVDPTPTTTSPDDDGDGVSVADGDCNDDDPSIHPGADELCNERDDDCDEEVDENATTTFYLDQDGDGHGVYDGDSHLEACSPPDGYAAAVGDCDDSDANVYPGAEELCNEQDDDCDDEIDEGITTTFYLDRDDDEYGIDDAVTNREACSAPPGYTATAGDCDDDEPLAYPGNPEVCDGIDNDCLSGIDDGVTIGTYYEDVDGDGFGKDGVTETGCTEPPFGSWADQGGDCDDGDDAVYPGHPELCDDKDNDCDIGTADPVDVDWYCDTDGDDYGADGLSITDCAQPVTTIGCATGIWVIQAGDCDEGDDTVHPGATELCDDIDNNCIDGVDEGNVATYVDGDSDGFGDENAAAVMLCEVKPGTADNYGDCDDGDGAINPDAPEIPGNGVDDDCDGQDANAGYQCGVDSLAALSLPYFYPGSLSTNDEYGNGPAGAARYWDDLEISTTAGLDFTILYSTTTPSTFRPLLYSYGPNSCGSDERVSAGSSSASPKGTYLSRLIYENVEAGYYYNALTTAYDGQTGSYRYEVLPGRLGTSCGGDNQLIYPVGWRREFSLTASDVQGVGTPVPAGHYADDFEVYLQAGTEYSLLLGGSSYTDQIYLARAGDCATSLGSSYGGIDNGGAMLLYTPAEDGVYALYATTTSAGVTGSGTINVVEGAIGTACFVGPGPTSGFGDPTVLYPLGGNGTGTLYSGDRVGDFGVRLFEDRETYLEAGDDITIYMTRTAGAFTPAIYLVREGACTTKVAEVEAPPASDMAVLNYVVPTGGAGIYAIIFTIAEDAGLTGAYSYSTSLN